ncbi:group II intron reverse transcriptase/maturase [Lactiplantibacillus plantarum]|nr:group II intron reverse transcriptase/maturase [Lactiplantibacillus argentoratensis]ARO02033.1 group II intron reverse transcriptase/maturase [Lactiplantibacillus plantarum]ARO02081.1 group II intron reverse transcriptase/maturase [Lactiplantibacillus plantarum]ARO02085.1 group II intron reverse transcriptase/maturase [Lactiplantibacillus plantarum]ARO02119.1 group II intron reverse transcriptase/maturase [Lactiplantibacillus plantarum]ARO02140.1 group II intron reverse transcriptase/matura
MDSLEDKEYLGAHSTTNGETTAQDGIQFVDRVLARNNLNLAFKRVRSNKGAAGMDGMTVDQLAEYIYKNREELLESLRNETYRPQPVRRVEIPKPDGSTRKLGVPTVIDRMIQQAVVQVLSPIYEQVFSDNSFGFRPGRSAHDAIKRVTSLYNQGYHYVVDLDLKAYFDTVNHDLLMNFIQQQITDPWLLHLIRRFLTSGVMNGKMFQRTDKGTPQGGNLSPLLANIYLNELDKLLTQRGHQFVRYADDCNIYVKSKRAGERVLRNVTIFLENKLRLTINRHKTTVGSPLQLKFLGFTLGVDRNGAYARPHKVVKQRVKQALKIMTGRSRGISWLMLMKEIKQKMRGWLQYYGIGKMKTFIYQLDQWLRSRIRQLIWKRWKRIKTRYRELIKLGMTPEQAKTNANTRKGYWRTAHSKTLTYTYTNQKLERLGLINLSKTLQQIQNA